MKSISLRFGNWGKGTRAPIIGVSLIAAGVFGMLYLGLPILFLPLGLGALVLAVITVRSPALGVGFIIAAQYIPLQVAGFTLLQLIGAFVALLCLLWIAVHKEGVVFPSIILPILVMMILALYSLTFTKDSALTLLSVRKLGINVLFCLLLVNVIDGYRRLRWLLWGLVGVGLINSAVAVLQFAGRSDPEFRATGLLTNENGLGMVAAIACIISCYQFLYARDRWRRMLFLGLCALLAAGMVTSASRGATIAFAASQLYVLMREVRYRKQVLVLAGLVLVGLFLVPETFTRRFINIGEELKGTIFFEERLALSSRGYYNKAGINIWKAHPLMGVGLGSYGYYFIQPEFNPGKKGTHRVPAHNMYIQALAETGLIGFLVLCWWVLIAVRNYWAAERRGGDDPQYRLYLGSCEALTLYTLISYFSSGSLTHTHLALVLALSVVCLRCAESAALDPTSAGQETGA